MASRIESRLRSLEAKSSRAGTVDTIIYAIVAPSENGPVETGRYLATVIGVGNFKNHEGESREDFERRIAKSS